jgi:hypothetical protein
MRVLKRRSQLGVAVACIVALAGCGQPPPTAAAGAGAPAVESFVPGLGELMSLQQMRHMKLWFAGQAGNWQLASYEIEELGEGFDDIVRFHPTHKDSPVAPKDAIPRMVMAPLADLRQAAEKRDAAAFTAAFDTLTAQCNSCHEATNFGFNRVQRPGTNPYPNQVFEPVRR